MSWNTILSCISVCAHALLVKRLVTNDSAKTATGPRGAGQSQTAFRQPCMPGWHGQLGMKAGYLWTIIWGEREGAVQAVTAIEGMKGGVYTFGNNVASWERKGNTEQPDNRLLWCGRATGLFVLWRNAHNWSLSGVVLGAVDRRALCV